MPSTAHILILLIIVVLIFGTKKLANVGKDLGSAVKGFKDGMADADKPAAKLEADPQVNQNQEQKDQQKV